MTLSPRKDPTPGDHLERGGVARRVLEVGPDYVRFDLPGMDREKPKRVERATWDRWAQRARPVAAPVERRDPKPAKILDQDRHALAAILDLTYADGWCRAGATLLRADAGLSHGAWQRAVARLERAELLERARAGKGDHYRLTDRGADLAAEAKAERHPADRPTTGPRGPVNQPTWADRSAHRPTEGGRGEVGSCSPLKPKAEKNQEPTNDEVENQPTTGPRIGPPAHDRPTRTLRVEHVHRLSDEDRALLGAWLASRSTLPALSSAAPTITAPEVDDERPRAAASGEPRPEPDHPPPPCSHCGAEAMTLTNGPLGWFWGCLRWRARGCPGLSLDEARAAWLEAQRAAEEQARQEAMRREREAREREDDERHRAEVAAMAEARRSRRNGRPAALAVGAAVETLLGAARPDT